MTTRPRHATIFLTGHGNVPALVELDGPHATAVLLARPLVTLAGLVGEEIAIQATTPAGLLRAEARIAAVGDDEQLELDVHGHADLVQRRSFARVDAFLEVLAMPVEGGATIPTAVVNISASGAVIARLDRLSPGDAVDLRLVLAPNEPPLEIGARVVRESERLLRAVHFERLHDADRERIVRFVIARQRHELKRGAS
jgi:c-di-GMP-binding flagellar brake protein YcgR